MRAPARERARARAAGCAYLILPVDADLELGLLRLFGRLAQLDRVDADAMELVLQAVVEGERVAVIDLTPARLLDEHAHLAARERLQRQAQLLVLCMGGGGGGQMGGRAR